MFYIVRRRCSHLTARESSHKKPRNEYPGLFVYLTALSLVDLIDGNRRAVRWIGRTRAQHNRSLRCQPNMNTLQTVLFLFVFVAIVGDLAGRLYWNDWE